MRRGEESAHVGAASVAKDVVKQCQNTKALIDLLLFTLVSMPH